MCLYLCVCVLIFPYSHLQKVNDCILIQTLIPTLTQTLIQTKRLINKVNNHLEITWLTLAINVTTLRVWVSCAKILR